MKINIHSIHPGGKNIQLDPNSAWIKSMAAYSLPNENPCLQTLSGSLMINCAEDNVILSGSFKIDLWPPCDRCGENFVYPLLIPVQMNLTPLSDNTEKRDFGQKGERLKADDKTAGGEESDLNYGFYSGVEIDLQKILGELIVLSIPFQFLCQADCAGLCPRCGENLNKAKCACKALKDKNPRWDALKTFKKK